VVLVEPNDAGGWTVTGPPETKSLVDLFDPEAEMEKRQRIKDAIDELSIDLLSGGVSAEKVAAKTALPLPLVEGELKIYAKTSAGLAAKRLDGKVVLFREGTVAAPPAGARAGASVRSEKGSDMPFIEKVKALFARKGETEKKIAFLSERRAALIQHRDRSYEEMGALEGRESQLRDDFKNSESELTKRRITSQLLQLRKDIERRQQLLSISNQQINVVSTHLHNLELVQQGQAAHLPSSDEDAADAAKAEDVLAELEASSELATAVGAHAASLSSEEQALYEELQREVDQGAARSEPTAPEPSAPVRAPSREPSSSVASSTSSASLPPLPPQRQRSEPEPG
jgi:hypothetical protein